MVPVSSAVASTQWRRWEGCAETRPGHALLEKATNAGIGRCTVELVPGRECWQDAKATEKR